MSEFTVDKSPISEETREIAETELRETPENIAKGLEELRKLLAEDDSLFFDTDDDTLIMFLRPCKFYPESAYKLMKKIADFKEKHKNLIGDMDPHCEKENFLNYNNINILKGKDHKGRRVLVVQCGEKWITGKVSSDSVFRMFYLIHIAALLEPETQVRGAIVIMDFHKMGMKQVSALSPAFSMKLLEFIQDALPIRLKEVHMVKEPFIFNLVWKIFKPFIREKLGSRIHFHGSKMASLHKFLPASNLPSDYGGELHEIDYTAADWYPNFDENLDFVKRYLSWGLKKKD